MSDTLHDGRLAWLLKTGKITHSKYASILQHGQAVLVARGLTRPSREERAKRILSQKIAPWEKWRLVIGEEEYEPLYKSFEEYKTIYGG